MAEGRARRFGAFEALQLLVGKGGQGRLFAARCLEEGAFEGLHVGDEVVLKAMPVRADDPEKAYRRLARRTAALVAARHPGIVRYYGCFETEGGGIDDAMHVVVMELLRGETLEERLRREPLGLDGAEALSILRACLEALVHASSFGIVHRDLKPSNVFLCEDGGVKLIDFEVARQATSAQTTTESGAMQGTFDYMAPDFHPNFRPDPKFRGDQCSDVFSLAVTFHEALAGRRPYAAGPMLGDQSMMAFFQRWTKADGADPRRAIRIDGVRIHALRHLQRVLRKALQPERSARYQTYAEFLAALARVEPRILEGGIGRYRLSKCIGKGGFGVVYKAFREGDGAAVAIKVLLRAEYAERFDREGRVLMRFADDRIVTFVEAFAGGDPMSPTHFLVMRYLEGMPGSSLKDRLAVDPSRRGLPRSETLAAFVRFAEGLQLLHDEGVYHRDVKPANLYFPAGEPERACLMDLGVVRTDETQTNGGLPGTLDYMAPELATGGSRGDASADLYALGLCLYEALTGRTAYPRLPRGSEGVAAFYARARSGEEPDLSGLDGEPELQALVRSMTAVDRSERPASAREAAHLLRAVPFREEAPREEIASGTVYSEDTTDDLVIPSPAVVPAESSSSPAEEEGEGGETQAVPDEAGGETVAAVPEGETAEGETAAFSPGGEEEAEPESAAAEPEAGDVTAVAPEPEPAAVVDAEAETRAPGEGELTATAVAETAAAADGGTTTAAVEGMTATAATMATDGETAATAAVEETAATAAFDAGGPSRKESSVPPEPSKSARRSAAGVREVRPRPRWRSFVAAACVLLLCGGAAGVYFFQDRLSEFFQPPVPPVVPVTTTTTTTTRKPVPPPVAPPTVTTTTRAPVPPPVTPTSTTTTWAPVSPTSKRNPLLASVDAFVNNVDEKRYAGEKVESEFSSLTNRFETETAGVSKEELSGWKTRIENARNRFWKQMGDGFRKRVENLLLNQAEDLTSADAATKALVPGNQLRKEILASPLADPDGELLGKVASWLTNVKRIQAERIAYETALDAAEKFRKAASSASSQEEREDLVNEASGPLAEAKTKGWSDVAKIYEDATNVLRQAIAAFETVEKAVGAAETAPERDFDALVKAYANLGAAKATPSIPADAETMRENAVAELERKLGKQYESFAKECEAVPTKFDYEKHVTEARRRSTLQGLPQAMRDQYSNLVSKITGTVTLTIQNKNEFAIRVRVEGVERKVEASGSLSESAPRWRDEEITATADQFSEDYEPWKRTVSVKNEGTNQIVELALKPAPSISLSSSNASEKKVLQVSLDGKVWHPLPWTFGPDAQLAPRTDYSIQWKINPESYPEDYKATDGRIAVKTGNRGNTTDLAIPSPMRRPNPVVSFIRSPGDPAFSVRFTGESEPGKPMTFTVEPRTPVTATFTRTNASDINEWFDIAPISFRTGNRGWTTNVVVRQERRPEIRVTNESKEAILLDGRRIEAGAEESFFGEKNKERTIAVEPAMDSKDSFFATNQTVFLSFGKAGSTTNLPIRLKIDVEKLRVGDVRCFYIHVCFVSWTNQLEQLKDELKQNHQEDLRAFLTSCDDWMETAKSGLAKSDSEITFKDIVPRSRCLLLERKLAEMIDDKTKKDKVEEEIRDWVDRLSGEDRFKKTMGSSTDVSAKAIWDEMISIAEID